jgi:hypothetical protein
MGVVTTLWPIYPWQSTPVPLKGGYADPRAGQACLEIRNSPTETRTPVRLVISTTLPQSPHITVAGKAIPLKALTGPEGSRRLRLPDFMTIGTWRWQGCQPCAPAAFTPGNIPGTHFCWSLSRPQGHRATGELCQWKILTPRITVVLVIRIKCSIETEGLYSKLTLFLLTIQLLVSNQCPSLG